MSLELQWWEIDLWSLQQKWCLWVVVLLWPIKCITFLGDWELKNCFKMALTDPGPTQIGLWAAIWENCQKYWLFVPHYNKKLRKLGNRDWAPEISYWTAPWATPDLHDNFIEKNEPYWSKLQKVMKLKMKNETERKIWE